MLTGWHIQRHYLLLNFWIDKTVRLSVLVDWKSLAEISILKSGKSLSVPDRQPNVIEGELPNLLYKEGVNMGNGGSLCDEVSNNKL